MNEEEIKKIAKQVFENLGLVPRDLPRKSAETPDFEVKGKNSVYTVELKTKEDDSERFNRIANFL